MKDWIEINDKCECQNQLFVDGNYLLNKIRHYIFNKMEPLVTTFFQPGNG